MKKLPSKFSLPLIGETLSFAGDAAGFLHQRARELGPVFEANLFGHPTACFVGPEAFSLLLDDKNVVRKGANPPHVEKIFNPKAVPFLDGDAQRRRKGLLMRAFTPDALEGYLPIVEKVIARYGRSWADLGSFQFVPELNALGFAVAGALFIGSDPNKDDPEIADAFGRSADGINSIPVNLPFTRFGKALVARDWLLGVIEKSIAAFKASPPETKHVLARLYEARLGEEKLDDEELLIETFHFFGAYSAVIGGLSYLVMALGQNPKVMERAREEVKKVSPSGALSTETLKQLEYVDRVTREARRCTPVLPLTFFGTVVRDLEFEGMTIPKGHKAIGCLGATLQDPKTYPEPERFDPDRWAKPSERQEKAWIPHGGGVHAQGHRCAGEELAHLMMKVLSVHLLRSYKWSFKADQDFSPTRDKLFATPRGGLHTRFERV